MNVCIFYMFAREVVFSSLYFIFRGFFKICCFYMITGMGCSCLIFFHFSRLKKTSMISLETVFADMKIMFFTEV